MGGGFSVVDTQTERWGRFFLCVLLGGEGGREGEREREGGGGGGGEIEEKRRKME